MESDFNSRVVTRAALVSQDATEAADSSTGRTTMRDLASAAPLMLAVGVRHGGAN